MSRQQTKARLAEVRKLLDRMDQRVDASPEDFAMQFLDDLLGAQRALNLLVYEIAGTGILLLDNHKGPDPIP